MSSCFASKKEEMMYALVVYDSQYGNTERIAQTIADTLGEFGAARAVGLDPGQGVELEGGGHVHRGVSNAGMEFNPPYSPSLKKSHPKSFAAWRLLAWTPASGYPA
jgi:flavodoxin